MNSYILERLNDFVHVNELAIVGLEWKIHIDASDRVRRHLIRSLFGSIENEGKIIQENQNCRSYSQALNILQQSYTKRIFSRH